MKRNLKVVVISDVHLGTYGCHARELLQYLNSIQPEILVLNGDIVDIWQFRKSYFPKSHLKVVKKLISMGSKGTKIYYLPGNHDEKLRRFNASHLGNIVIKNKLVLKLDGKKALFFHGDVFDASIKHAKWLAKLGGWAYDLLIRLNRIINYGLVSLGKEKYSLSKKIKNNIKQAVSFISNFEHSAVQYGLENDADFVICGHIHQPAIHSIKDRKSQCLYLNSGDWVENLTALEYHNKTWKLYFHNTKQRLMKLDITEQTNQEGDLEMISAFVQS